MVSQGGTGQSVCTTKPPQVLLLAVSEGRLDVHVRVSSVSGVTTAFAFRIAIPEVLATVLFTNRTFVRVLMPLGELITVSCRGRRGEEEDSDDYYYDGE